MKINKKVGISAQLGIMLFIALAFIPSINANPNNNGLTKSEKALELISQKHAIPKEQLIITSEAEGNYSLTNRKIWSSNILDTKTKEFYYVDLDEAGNNVDINAVRALEDARYREIYGKKEVALHEKLKNLNPDDTVEVGIWLSPMNLVKSYTRYVTT